MWIVIFAILCELLIGGCTVYYIPSENYIKKIIVIICTILIAYLTWVNLI